MVRKLYKKGASPLIATIVLIAFAVSLGGFVMSLGGFYHDKIKSMEPSCSKVFVNVFELEDSNECAGREYNMFLNFYEDEDKVRMPNCYKEAGKGEGNVCGNTGFLNTTWIPSGKLIK